MFITHRAVNSVEYLTSTIIRSPHAFSTRIGGVSDLSYTSGLNLAFNRGDSPKTVLENLSLFAEAVGFDPKSVISLPQIHSTIVLEVDKSMAGLGYYRDPDESADGYVASESEITLGVKSADCVPILLEAYGGNGEIIAVCALHAGWRGTAAGIAAEGVKKLVERGAAPSRIRAAIGPSIDVCCFEVGEDFAEAAASLGGDKLKPFCRDGKLYADLKAYNGQVLLSCGLEPENIDICDECTCCMADKYYSHRRMKGQRGTMLSVIKM